MPETTLLYPTTIVGSYTRPSWLLDAYRTLQPRGSIASPQSEDQLNELRKQAKLLTIKEEEDAGLDIISDGEQGRTSFFEYLTEQLSGFAFSRSKPFSDGTRFMGLRKPVGKVEFQQENSISASEAEFLREHTKRKSKVAVISPNFLSTYWERSDYYPSQDAFVQDMIKASQKEAEALSGKVDYIQWDDPLLSLFTEEKFLDSKARELTRDAVQTVNDVARYIPTSSGTKKALHICWGNYKATHQADGPLAKIFPELLELKVDLLLLELASARHEEDIETFKEYPTDRLKLGAGVIDVKTPDIEPVKLVKKRVERISKYVPAERLVLSTDCGFAPEWDSDRIPRSSCYLKLRSMSLAAQELRAAK